MSTPKKGQSKNSKKKKLFCKNNAEKKSNSFQFIIPTKSIAEQFFDSWDLQLYQPMIFIL